MARDAGHFFVWNKTPLIFHAPNANENMHPILMGYEKI